MAKVKQEPVTLAHLDELRQFCLTLRARNKKPTHRLADRPAICDPQFADLRQGVVAWDRSQGWQLCPRWWVVLQKKRDTLTAQLEQERLRRQGNKRPSWRKQAPITIADLDTLAAFCIQLDASPTKASGFVYTRPRNICGPAYHNLREGVLIWNPSRGWTLAKTWRSALNAKQRAAKEQEGQVPRTNQSEGHIKD